MHKTGQTSAPACQTAFSRQAGKQTTLLVLCTKPDVRQYISSNDQINRVKHQLNDYRSSGVQVVWHIFPAYQQVEVYTGERLQFSTLYEGDQICSAAPALPDFQLPVSAIFQHEASSKHSGNKI